jgi:hypothetical protein
MNFLLTPLIDFIVGKIIESGTGGDATKIVARATELIAINTALTQINAGNSAGVTALQAALNTQALSPGEGLALSSLFATLGTQLAAIQSVAGATLLGTANTAIADAILGAATTTAQAYVTKYTPAPAAAAK